MADARIQDLDPVNQVQDNDNFVLEQNKKAHRLTGSKLIRYLITACDNLGILGVHVGPDEPKENQNVWIEEAEDYDVPDEAFSAFDSRYHRKSEANQLFANALTRIVSGKTVSINDASPLIHKVGCHVQSINIIPIQTFPILPPVNGVTFTPQPDGTVEMSGTCTGDDATMLYFSDSLRGEPGTWTFNGVPAGCNVNFALFKSGVAIIDQLGSGPFIVDCPDGFDTAYVNFYVPVGTNVDGLAFKPMLRKGDTDLPFIANADRYFSQITVTQAESGETHPSDPEGNVTAFNSYSPDMTFSSNNSSVEIYITYNADTRKAFNNVPSKTSQLTNDSGFITASDAPVQSVNGQTGAVTVEVPAKTSELTNNSGFITADDVPVPFDDTQVSKEKGWTSSKIAQSVAPALTRTVTGEVIAVDDVSPLEHSVGCKVESKNKIIPKSEIKPGYSETINGITFNVNSDLSVSLSGTSTGYASFIYSAGFKIGSGHFMASGNPAGSAYSKYYMAFSNLPGISGLFETQTGFHTAGSDTARLAIAIAPNQKMDGKTFKPQIELGSTPTPYTPYIPDLSKVTVTQTPGDKAIKADAEGNVAGFKSKSPEMGFAFDTPGALLDVTYNADPMTIIDKLTQRVADLESATAQI